MLFKEGKDFYCALLDCLLIGVYNEIRVERFFVGVVYAGETVKFASEGKLVHAFDVPFLADLDGTSGIDLKKRADRVTRFIPAVTIW